MKTKILFAGLGGVGGYYGGLMARKYANNDLLEINFLARGKHLTEIKKNGLRVITETDEFICQPALITENAKEAGIQDYIILSTKSYDLENTVLQLQPCIGPNTVILPLLNGVDISLRISKMLPKTEIWDGCVYIVGRLTEPGVVQSSGGIHDLFFGNSTGSTQKLAQIHNWLISAGIEAHLSNNIRMIIWKKFIFISTTATLTSYYNVGFRDLLTDTHRREMTLSYMNEVVTIAKAEGIVFDNDILGATIRHIEKLPFGTTSSMHSDFSAKRKTELETLTGIVIRLGNQYKVKTPVCEAVFYALKNR